MWQLQVLVVWVLNVVSEICFYLFVLSFLVFTLNFKNLDIQFMVLTFLSSLQLYIKGFDGMMRLWFSCSRLAKDHKSMSVRRCATRTMVEMQNWHSNLFYCVWWPRMTEAPKHSPEPAMQTYKWFTYRQTCHGLCCLCFWFDLLHPQYQARLASALWHLHGCDTDCSQCPVK